MSLQLTIPWDSILKLHLFYCGNKWTQNSDRTKILSWFLGQITQNHRFQNVIKRWDFFLRPLSLFCILPFFYRASHICISWELAQEDNNTPNQQTKRTGKVAASPTKKQSKFWFPVSATNSLGCSGALTPFSHKELFHRSGSGSSLSIQHFRKGHQVSLLPPCSPFLFSMILPWGSSLGLLPFCLVHNQQKGRYITSSHQEYDSPWWSDFIYRASLQWSNFSALKENLACTIQLGGIPNTKICIRWGQTISYYTVKAVPRPWI